MRWLTAVTLVTACSDGPKSGSGGTACGVGLSCAANLSSDPHNCGWCGHDCSGAPCSDGVCEPLMLDQSPSVGSIVSDGTNVFYGVYPSAISTETAIKKIPVDGGTPITLTSLSGGSLTLVGDNLYFTAGGIAVINKNGGAVQMLTGSQYGARAMALNSTHAYFFGSNPDNSMSALMRVPLAGGAVETLTTTTSTQFSFDGGFAIDADAAYFSSNHAVYRVPLAGGMPSPLATSVWAFGLAVDSDFVYYSDVTGPSPGNVYKVPRGGGNASIVAMGAPIGAVLLDGDALFWSDITGLRAMNKTGGASCLYFKPAVGNIAVDDRYVYTYGANNLFLMRTAR